MPDETEAIYPRLVLKAPLPDDETEDAFVVLTLELSADPEEVELTLSCGYLSDLDSEILEVLVKQGERIASELNVVFECLIDEDDISADEND